MSHGRHRRPAARPATSRARVIRTSVAGATIAAGAAGAVMGASPASADIYSQIRNCESGGNYSTNTGNGYYGAYQFSQSTWNSLGLGGTPSSASPATQDAAAAQLAARSGFGQWPVCGAGGGSAAAAPSYSAPQRSYTPQQSYAPQQSYVPQRQTYYAPQASRSYQRPAVAVQQAPSVYPFFTTALVSQVRADVRKWQQAMADRHYAIAADGQYGPKSEAVAKKFQHDKGLLVDGIVGPQTWRATFG